MRVSAAAILALISAASPQMVMPPAGTQPPRDVVRRPDPTGTAIIRGRVITSDSGNPVRRANVNLMPVAPPVPLTRPADAALLPPQAGGGRRGGTIPDRSGAPGRGGGFGPSGRPRQATTDMTGAFEFTGLPAGSYRLQVSADQYSAQYLSMAYGAKAPSGPFAAQFGQPIRVSDGETFDKAIVALPRGSVIAGRVTDESGEPVVRVQVFTLFFPPGSTRGQRMGAGDQTDDLGQFRLFGLYPGEYVVVAEARENSWVQPNAPPESEADKVGYMTTYYPGTTDESGAQRIRTRVASETGGIEIRLGQGRLFHVSGTVMDSQGRPLARANGQLARTVGGMMTGNFGFETSEQGQFQLRSIPPGNYRLIVRQQSQMMGPRGRGAQPDPGEMASVPITITADVDDITVATAPGTAITGHVVFEQGPPTPFPSDMRVIATFGNPEEMRGVQSPGPVPLAHDLTFAMKGLMGEYLLRAFAPNQFVRSVTVNGEDITDTPHEFKTNDRVVITLTARASTVEGIVTDGTGAVSPEAGIIVFSDDKTLWRQTSTRTRRGVSDAEGHFRVTGLMPGRYLIAAVPRARLSVPGNADAAFFEQLSKEATPLVVGEDEQRRIDLKIVEGTGIQ